MKSSYRKTALLGLVTAGLLMGSYGAAMAGTFVVARGHPERIVVRGGVIYENYYVPEYRTRVVYHPGCMRKVVVHEGKQVTKVYYRGCHHYNRVVWH